jgi:hypothetical protein
MRPYKITFTDGSFEKSIKEQTLALALEAAKDSVNWPIEISNYSKMTTIISWVEFSTESPTGIEQELTFDYEELLVAKI